MRLVRVHGELARFSGGHCESQSYVRRPEARLEMVGSVMNAGWGRQQARQLSM
jgi:hypothetical protein